MSKVKQSPTSSLSVSFFRLRSLAILLLVVATGAVAQDALTPLRVLAIGNSFSEDAVEQYLYELGREAGYELVIGNAYRPGQSLASHWRDASTRATATEYRKVVGGKRTNQKGKSLRAIITDEPWDVITFQQVSFDAGQPDSYEPGLSLMIGYVRALARVDSVRLGFQQTWAYAQDSDHKGFANYNRNQYLMYANITTAVEVAMRYHENDLTFYIPTGTAIQNARATSLVRIPTTGTGKTAIVNRELTRDGYHLNLTVGRYIAACTWLEALTGVSTVGFKYRPKGVTAEQAALAQQAAHGAILVPMAVTPIAP